MDKHNQFCEKYINGIIVNEKRLDESSNILEIYRGQGLKALTIKDLRRKIREFGFLTWGVVKSLDKLDDTNLSFLKNLLVNSESCSIESQIKYADFIYPKYILMGYIYSKKTGLPEYWAAYQYVKYLLEKS